MAVASRYLPSSRSPAALRYPPMVPIRKKAYARAGLAGNPSDGYFGKTLSVAVRDFWAEAAISESDELVLTPSREDQGRFASVDALVRDVRLHGYYGGLRLVKATVKRFAEYCRREGHALGDRNFTLRYESNIPRQVGLAGSSAIVVATLRCLMEFHGVEIPTPLPAVVGVGRGRRRVGRSRRPARPRHPGVRRARVHGFRPRANGRARRSAVRGLRGDGPGPAAAAVLGLQRRGRRADRGLPRQPPRPFSTGRAGSARSDCAPGRPGGASPLGPDRGRCRAIRTAAGRQLRAAPLDLSFAGRADGHGPTVRGAWERRPILPAPAAPSSARIRTTRCSCACRPSLGPSAAASCGQPSKSLRAWSKDGAWHWGSGTQPQPLWPVRHNRPLPIRRICR